jgi:prolipoprotein diacylglyceryltransferase
VLGAIYWNPPREAFKIPFIDHYIAWYGILFVTGFIFSYYIVYQMLTLILLRQGTPDAKKQAIALTDRLTWFVVLGTIIGARLGHVLFYDPMQYFAHPLEIFKTW